MTKEQALAELAELNTISEEDFDALLYSYLEPVGTPHTFNGYRLYGYVGHEQRNYITDAWTLAGANALGWTLGQLSGWMETRYGRWACEAGIMDAREWQDHMADAPDFLTTEDAETR